MSFMFKLKNIYIIFFCAILLVGNVLNASVSCCMLMSQDEASIEQKMADMPCHEDSISQEQEHDCNSCDCNHFFNALIESNYQKSYINIETVEILIKENTDLNQTYSLFHPPKNIF